MKSKTLVVKRLISIVLSMIMVFASVSMVANAKVKKYVKSISVKKKATITIPVNKKTVTKAYKVTVKVRGKITKKFTAKSSKPSVASVKVSDNKIKIVAKKAGKAVVTVTTKGKNQRKKKLSKKLNITVKKAKKTTVVTPTEPQDTTETTQPTTPKLPPVLGEDEYAITYHLYDGDTYLEKVGIENANPCYYSSEEGLKLSNVKADGYIFEGWYDGEGTKATLVKEIEKGETGSKELYARWTAREYTVQFDSPLVKVDSIKYKVNEGTTLTNPDWKGYTFLGWSNEKGEIVDKVSVGTIGNITLSANWTSKRNQTVPVSKLDDPIIYEDNELGQYLFVYKIGRIENVPLFTIMDYGHKVSGIDETSVVTKQDTISETQAENIAEVISKATTKTSLWTLSKDWNSMLTVNRTHTDESGSDTTVSEGRVDDNSTVNITNNESGGSETSASKNGISAKVSAAASAKYMGANFSVSAEAGAQQETTNSNVKIWNDSTSFENSSASSTNESTVKALNSKISDTYGYSSSSSEGGSESLSSSIATAQTNSREYATSFSYSTQQTIGVSTTVSNAEAEEGYYRLVEAGTVHVFAVVGYDIATSSYFVYTYNILDDETHRFWDYSKTTQEYDDYENGALPFEVPIEVNDYVDSMITKSEGLVVDPETGKIVEYNGEAKNVVVPEYIALDNGTDTPSVVKITGFEANAFSWNNDITSIKFGKSVTDIPASSFEGCGSLKTVECPSVNSIGDRAFSGCVALENFEVSQQVLFLGIQAFEGVGKLTVNAVNTAVADAAIYSGAKKIILNNVSETSILENKIVAVPDTTDYFAFNGYEKTYKGLRLISDATTTVINGVTITDVNGVPLKFSSKNVTLNRVSVETSDIGMILTSDDTQVSLFGTVIISSSSGNSVLCKNIDLSRENSNAIGTLSLYGNLMICGSITGGDLLAVTDGEIIEINDSSYEKLNQDSLDWVLESEVPTGAAIVSEKWTYNLTTNITSKSKSVEGYTLYDTADNGKWGSWSSWSKNKYIASSTRQVQTKDIAATYKTQYNYNKWSQYSDGSGQNGPTQGTWNGIWCGYNIERGWSDAALSVWSTQSSGGSIFNLYGKKGNSWYNQKTRKVQVTAAYKQYRYRDYTPDYTYYLTKTEVKESDTVVSNSNEISNVQKWVKYVIE